MAGAIATVNTVLLALFSALSLLGLRSPTLLALAGMTSVVLAIGISIGIRYEHVQRRARNMA